MKVLCPKTFPPEIDFAILDIDLVSLLWLENYNEKSSLPIDVLIANALALNLASPEIMDRAIELTEQLVETGDISEEAALTIRSQPKMKKYLGEVTQNDIASLTHSSLQQALNQYVDDTTVKVQEEFDAVSTISNKCFAAGLVASVKIPEKFFHSLPITLFVVYNDVM